MTVRRLTILVLLPLLLGLLVPVSGHGDMYLSTYNSSLILTDHPNVYHAVADEPSGVLPNGLSGAPYGPLFYYPTALWLQALDTAHLINVQGWQSDTFDSILRDLPVNFLLKLPYLAVYLLVAFVLTKTLRGRRGEIAAVLWLVNPAVILYGLLMGQNDGWAFLASAVGLALAMRALEGEGLRIGGREVPLRLLAMIALAAGAAIKLTPDPAGHTVCDGARSQLSREGAAGRGWHRRLRSAGGAVRLDALLLGPRALRHPGGQGIAGGERHPRRSCTSHSWPFSGCDGRARTRSGARLPAILVSRPSTRSSTFCRNGTRSAPS